MKYLAFFAKNQFRYGKICCLLQLLLLHFGLNPDISSCGNIVDPDQLAYEVR